VTPCPANCGREQKPGRFLCQQCWQALSDHLRAWIWDTWRAFNKQRTVQAVREYRDARETCLEHLNERRKETA